MGAHPYQGRKAVLATMHGKQAAIAPSLKSTPGLELVVPDGLDTDSLGTFAGEIKRPGDMMETAIAKARLGMQLSGLPLGIASEGSFGPHPQVPFLAAGVELLVLIDDERGLVISEQQLFADTNHAHASGRSPAGVAGFLDSVGFPGHAVIVRPDMPGGCDAPIMKGIRDRDELEHAMSRCSACSQNGLALVQTDMRAHMNPGRMQAIATLAGSFAGRISALCPACDSPGFGRSQSIAGLPCSWCGEPSTMVRWIIESCPACNHQLRLPRPDGLANADPMHCLSCNP